MMLFSRLLPPLSFGAVMLMTAFPAHSALQSGTVTFDNQTIHYQLFTGKDESYFQSFAAGAIVTNFETPPAGVTPFQTNSYTNQNVGTNNFVSPKSPIGDIYYSAGGQTPGDPAKASSTPFIRC